MTPAEAYAALVAAGGELAVDGRRLVVRTRKGTPAEVRENALAHHRALWWVQSGHADQEMQSWTEDQTERWTMLARVHLAAGVPRLHCGPLSFLQLAAEHEAAVVPARVA